MQKNEFLILLFYVSTNNTGAFSSLYARRNHGGLQKQNRNKFRCAISVRVPSKKRQSRSQHKPPMCHDFRNYTNARLKPARLTRINLLVLDIRKSELQFVGSFSPFFSFRYSR